MHATLTLRADEIIQRKFALHDVWLQNKLLFKRLHKSINVMYKLTVENYSKKWEVDYEIRNYLILDAINNIRENLH